MNAAEQLVAAFPQGALVELNEGGGDPADPPVHHCAAIYVISGNTVLFWDSSVGNFYTGEVTALETQQETPVLLVKVTTANGYWRVRSETSAGQLAYNVGLRLSQGPMVRTFQAEAAKTS